MKNVAMLLALIGLSVFTIGCADDPTGENGGTGTAVVDDGHGHDHAGDDPHAGHDHAAADHSPKHGGHLIELGRNHEYHAELVDDHDAKSVTVYIMDGDLKSLAINQASVNLVLTAGEETQNFELLASQPGASAEFSSNDENLMAMIDKGDVKGKLRVTIEGKPFSGSFDHHAHAHGDHSGHDH